MRLLETYRAKEPFHKGSFVCFFVLCGLVVLDVLTRWWCFKVSCLYHLAPGFGVGVFANDKFAFSLPVPTILMYLVYILALGLVLWYMRTRWIRLSGLARFAWLLICIGALTNVIERLWLGYVRDFIHVGTGYMNLGDVYIIVGAVYMLYTSRTIEHSAQKD